MNPAQLAPHDDAPGPLLTSGRDADVYALDDDRVLRRNRNGESVLREAAVVRHVWAHGFPAPQVFRAEGADLEMERLHGPTLLQALAAEEVPLREGAVVLAELLNRLHRLPVPQDDLLAVGGPDDVVVHLDLHPGNVVLTESHGPAVVDWSAAGLGSASLDVATTALLLAEVAADEGGDYSNAAQVLLVAFLAAVDHDPLPALDEAVRLRIRDTTHLVEGERELVPAAAALVTRYAHGAHS
ncbi:phosphotransferase [Cellulomonas sp. NS3]|uniref:phosphotransferase n=1 Tax=Cellulomonas sp. NS3 TaxID=2973977 RepID=UPI0021636F73|nr:phosphotransferase [Cellulomonas sp. NS3]